MEEATAAPPGRASPRLELAIVVLAVAFVVLAALVAAGRLDSLDHYAVVHWMPGLDPARAGTRIPAGRAACSFRSTSTRRRGGTGCSTP